MTAPTPDRRRFSSRSGLEGEIVDRSPRMPTLRPDLDALITEIKRLNKGDLDGSITEAIAVLESFKAVTAERDEARQKLTEAPHAPGCWAYSGKTGFPAYPDDCNCWRAEL